MQPVLLKMQRLDHSGGVPQRIERAEGVGDEIRMQFPITADGPADLRLRLQQQRFPSGIHQSVCGYQAVGARTDDNRIDLTRQRHIRISEHRPSAGDRHPSAGNVATVIGGEQNVNRR